MIWDRILQFAMDVDQYPYKFATPDNLSALRLYSTYKHISMVSKTFRVRYLIICPVMLFSDQVFVSAAFPPLRLS